MIVHTGSVTSEIKFALSREEVEAAWQEATWRQDSLSDSNWRTFLANARKKLDVGALLLACGLIDGSETTTVNSPMQSGPQAKRPREEHQHRGAGKKRASAAAVPRSPAHPPPGSPYGPSSFATMLPPGLGYPSTLAPRAPRISAPPMVGLPGQTYNGRLLRWVRYPRDATSGTVLMSACMFCGQGSTPSSVGHRSAECNATDEQRDQWVQYAIPVP